MLDMPQAGGMAPDFELPSTHGALRLSDLLIQKKVVLAFYQEDSTPLCSSQLAVLKEDYDLVRHLRAEVVAVSADGLDSHKEFARSLGGLPFPLVSDPDLEATRAFGVLDDGGKRSRRAVFVIDRGGAILHVVPWFQPGNPTQYEEIFAALGFDV
ncbi:MAG TPA: redoxin domain-containing protein [Methylomirabilota bacterium]|nr:redoxin domain-containing protein [Methylomirabilota bacterium]